MDGWSFEERDPKGDKQNEFWLAGKQLPQGYCRNILSEAQRNSRHQPVSRQCSVVAGLRTMKVDDAQDGLVATIVGWRCCCDIELRRAETSWRGDGNSRKTGNGHQFEIAVSETDSGLFLKLKIHSEDGKVFEGHSTASCDTDSYCLYEFNSGDFFGPPEAKDGTDRSLLRVALGQHAALKRDFRNYAFGLSYMPVVLDRFLINPPSSILEWGPGRSSLFFAELFPDARITGVEHDPRWFEHCKSIATTFPNVSMELRRLKLAPAQSEAYVSFPLYDNRKYDLIFIDGRLRADCMAIAGLVLAEGGVVLVHDAHRENYQSAYRLFRERQVICNTAMLAKPLRTR